MKNRKFKFVAIVSAICLIFSSLYVANADTYEKLNPKTYSLSTSTYTYNAKEEAKPNVFVTDTKGNVIESTKYTLSYKNNVNPGKASVTVTYLGNAAQAKTLNYIILPKKAEKPTLSKKKQKQFTVTFKENTLVAGHQIRYSTSKSFKKAKTVTMANYKGLSKTITKLKNNKKYYVSIRAYITVDGKKYYGAWSSKASIKTSSKLPHAELPDEMIDSYVVDAMRYVGYKIDKQAKEGSLLQDYASGPRTPVRFRSGISYGGGPNGQETVKSKKTVSGKAPNVAKFKREGLVCASFVSYYYLNYLPNVAGVDTSFIKAAIKKSGIASRQCNSWGYAAEYLVKKGKATVVDSVKYGQSLPAANLKKLQIGDLITFRVPNEGLEWGHVAVYAGTNNQGDHFVAHVGSDEGPVFQTLERFENIVNAYDGCAYKKVYRFKGVTKSKYDYSVTLSKKSFKYTGKAITPEVTVNDATGKTIDAKNYTVYYRNNTKKGTASVHVVFKGKYKGTKKVTFKIK